MEKHLLGCSRSHFRFSTRRLDSAQVLGGNHLWAARQTRSGLLRTPGGRLRSTEAPPGPPEAPPPMACQGRSGHRFTLLRVLVCWARSPAGSRGRTSPMVLRAGAGSSPWLCLSQTRGRFRRALSGGWERLPGQHRNAWQSPASRQSPEREQRLAQPATAPPPAVPGRVEEHWVCWLWGVQPAAAPPTDSLEDKPVAAEVAFTFGDRPGRDKRRGWQDAFPAEEGRSRASAGRSARLVAPEPREGERPAGPSTPSPAAKDPIHALHDPPACPPRKPQGPAPSVLEWEAAHPPPFCRQTRQWGAAGFLDREGAPADTVWAVPANGGAPPLWGQCARSPGRG